MIDPTKTTPEKLAEMNDSLIVDNQYLRTMLTAKVDWIESSKLMPVHGQLVVKLWRDRGTVWAGIHEAKDKHSSFDAWIGLPYASRE